MTEKKISYLLVDTDGYSGNFERELSSYALGVLDEYAGQSDDWLPDEDVLEADPVLEDYYSFWQEAVDNVYTEYGSRPFEMWPDRSGSYRSIRYKLTSWAVEELAEKPAYLAMLKVKLEEAAAKLTYSDERDQAGNPLPLKILGLRMVTETTTVTEVDLI